MIVFLWRGKFHCKLHWLLHLLAITMYVSWIFLTGRWDWLGYPLRYVWVLLLLVTIIYTYRKIRHLPFYETFNPSQKFSITIDSILFAVFGLYVVMAMGSYSTNDHPIELSFPLQDGTYYAGQAGSHTQMNYHNAYLTQQYAVDVSKLNAFGFRANGIYPKDLEDYAIYGDTLYSPCSGELLEVRNNLPDLVPPNADPEHPEGNYVALVCEGTEAILYIAHMKEGSIVVEQGSAIEKGAVLGQVGNSGNTSEPHLHIHAELNGEGVPLLFEGRFLVRNSLVKTREGSD